MQRDFDNDDYLDTSIGNHILFSDHLTLARECAETGVVLGVEYHISYVSLSQEEKKAIMRTAHKNSIIYLLRQASDSIDSCTGVKINDYLDKARKYASVLNIDISDKLSEFEVLCEDVRRSIYSSFG